MTLLRITSLSKAYGTTAALADVSLSVTAGSRTVIVGASGSGKTTLLRLVAGFEAPDAGQIELDGQLIANAAVGVPPHRRNIGLVMQEGALFPHLTVIENIQFGIRNRPDAHLKALALMDMAELDRNMAQRQPHQLSGGQQQRVALARALARQPSLMLLDEPFSALDAGLREQMRDATAQILKAAGVATILVTHDQDEAMAFADQLVVLRGGKMVQSGSPSLLYREPADAVTAAFLGPAIILPATFAEGNATCVLGTLPASGRTPSGAANVLIRPEQLSIEMGSSSESRWMISAVQDRGNRHAVTVRRQIGETSATISFERSGPNKPVVGSHVNIAVAGLVHGLNA